MKVFFNKLADQVGNIGVSFVVASLLAIAFEFDTHDDYVAKLIFGLGIICILIGAFFNQVMKGE